MDPALIPLVKVGTFIAYIYAGIVSIVITIILVAILVVVFLAGKSIVKDIFQRRRELKDPNSLRSRRKAYKEQRLKNDSG